MHHIVCHTFFGVFVCRSLVDNGLFVVWCVVREALRVGRLFSVMVFSSRVKKEVVVVPLELVNFSGNFRRDLRFGRRGKKVVDLRG